MCGVPDQNAPFSEPSPTEGKFPSRIEIKIDSFLYQLLGKWDLNVLNSLKDPSLYFLCFLAVFSPSIFSFGFFDCMVIEPINVLPTPIAESSCKHPSLRPHSTEIPSKIKWRFHILDSDVRPH
jgi:hypothetical protein